MKILTLILFFSLAVLYFTIVGGCSPKGCWFPSSDYSYGDLIRPPDACVVISKTLSFDTVTSKNLKLCDEVETNSIKDCILKKGNKRYVKIYTALYDKTQSLTEVVEYKPMGSIIHTLQELKKDTNLFNSFSVLSSRNFRIDKTKSFVIDNADSLRITKVWSKEKLIFVSTSKLNQIAKGQTIIYGYEQ